MLVDVEIYYAVSLEGKVYAEVPTGDPIFLSTIEKIDGDLKFCNPLRIRRIHISTCVFTQEAADSQRSRCKTISAGSRVLFLIPRSHNIPYYGSGVH